MFLSKYKHGIFAGMLFATVVLTSCNKEPEQIPGTGGPTVTSGATLGDTLRNIASDSLYYRLILKARMEGMLTSRSNYYTLFVPDNNAMKQFINAASGGQVPLNAPDAVFSGFINNFITLQNARAIVSYNIIPQMVPAFSFPATFPNMQYPTIFNPAPQLSSFFRLTGFISSRNGFYINNIPIVAPDLIAANGVIHGIPAINLPPSQYLWDRISSDADLTLLKAVIERADSAGPALVPALQNIGANFTVFAPTNSAVKQLISNLSGGQIPVAAPDAVFINFIGSNFLSTFLANVVVAYHVLDGRNVTNKPGLLVERPGRAYLNNFPTSGQLFKTLLNYDSTASVHPGVQLQATFTGPIVSAATVRGWGNSSASNVLIDPTPSTGSSDQQYLNGTIHKIDQVLLPQ
jgi:hypothetical protein